MTGKLSLDDVLNELMLEEPEPTDEALARWSERYPHYRHDLADFFATWREQRDLPEEAEPKIDEERLVQQGVDYAMEILRKQGRIISPDSIGPVSPFDQLVLAAVFLLHGVGNDMSITEKVSEMSGRRVLLAFTFTALERLERAYLISGRDSDPQSEPDGESRRYFTMTLAGERVLARETETSKLLTDLLGDFA
jgi:PadR family transcriptional regulator, regulatory protein PadR